MFANEVLAALVVKDSGAGADALVNASHAESKVNKNFVIPAHNHPFFRNNRQSGTK